jgi:hypothetical protein
MLEEKDLLSRFLKQTGAKSGAANDNDVDKQLEIDLCKYFYKTDNVKDVSKIQDFQGIDCLVNDTLTVQVKCHSDKAFIIEDKKLNRQNVWIPGNVDRCNAKIFLNVYPNEKGELVFEEFQTTEVKQVLEICRMFYRGFDIDWSPEKTKLLAKFGGTAGEYHLTKNKRAYIFVFKR